MTELFRRCPQCGKRFHVKLESKTLLDEQREERDGHYGGIAIVDIDENQYKYKCQVCGHEWSEKRIEDKLESAS